LHDVRHVHGIIVANSIIDRQPIKLDFRTDSTHRRKRALWVQINYKDPVAAKREIVGQVNSGGALAATAFEVHQLPDLELFFGGSARNIPSLCSGRTLQNLTRVPDFLGSVVSTATPDVIGLRDGSLRMHLSHKLAGNTQKLGDFRSSEFT